MKSSCSKPADFGADHITRPGYETLGLVRFNAAAWHIDPHKIGVLGFSAGGHMVAGRQR